MNTTRHTPRLRPHSLLLVLLATGLVATSISFGVRKYLVAATPGEPTTLTVWLLGGNHSEKRFNDELLRRYERERPRVKVQITYFGSLDDYLRALNGALAGQTPLPDLARGDQGAHSVDAAIRQGRLLDLTAAARVHKWRERLQPGMLEYLSRRYSGGTYLIPSRIHFAGVFYNRQVFEKLRLQEPQTEAEFETLLEKLKQTGIAPLAIGAQTSDHFAYHWYALVNNRLGLLQRPPRETLDDLFAGKPAVSFDSAPFRQGMEKLRQWHARGYFARDFRQLSGTDAYDRFLQGGAPLFFGLGGTWAQTRAQLHPPQFVIGFFPFPPAVATERRIAIGAPTAVWQVFKGARAEAAIDLIDWMLSGESGRFMIENQSLPALRLTDLGGVSLAPHVAEELAALPNCDLGIFYDNASPSLREVRGRGLVQTVVGEMEVNAFTAAIQAAFLRDLQQVDQASAPIADAPQ